MILISIFYTRVPIKIVCEILINIIFLLFILCCISLYFGSSL